MSNGAQTKLPTNMKPDAALMRCVWLLNAAAVDFVETKQLLEEVATILPETVVLVDQENMPSDRKELFTSELKRFHNQCTDLIEVLLQARGDSSDNKIN